MHVYPDHIFVVLHTPQHGIRGHVHYIELDQFIGPNYVVTVHGPINPLADPQVASRETREVLQRIEKGHVTPTTPHELSYAIVSALARHQEAYIETLTSEVWQLEQQVTGGNIDDPQEFVNQMFRARHGLLAVRTISALSAAIYGRMGRPGPAPCRIRCGWSPTSRTNSNASAVSPTESGSTCKE